MSKSVAFQSLFFPPSPNKLSENSLWWQNHLLIPASGYFSGIQQTLPIQCLRINWKLWTRWRSTYLNRTQSHNKSIQLLQTFKYSMAIFKHIADKRRETRKTERERERERVEGGVIVIGNTNRTDKYQQISKTTFLHTRQIWVERGEKIHLLCNKLPALFQVLPHIFSKLGKRKKKAQKKTLIPSGQFIPVSMLVGARCSDWIAPVYKRLPQPAGARGGNKSPLAQQEGRGVVSLAPFPSNGYS